VSANLAWRLLCAIGGCVALWPSAAGAVTVNNFSFESPVLAGGGGAFNENVCPTSWSCTGSAGGFGGGIYVPTSTQFAPGSDGLASGIVPDGSQVAWITGSTPQVLEQDTVAIAANTNYTLSVWLGARADQSDVWSLSPPFLPTIELLANGVVVAMSVTTDPGSGKWGDYSLSWTSLAADVGDTLGIEVFLPSRLPGDSTNDQVAVDDVTLNSARVGATPIPGGLPLFIGGLGLIGLVGRSRRRKVVAA